MFESTFCTFTVIRVCAYICFLIKRRQYRLKLSNKDPGPQIREGRTDGLVFSSLVFNRTREERRQ